MGQDPQHQRPPRQRFGGIDTHRYAVLVRNKVGHHLAVLVGFCGMQDDPVLEEVDWAWYIFVGKVGFFELLQKAVVGAFSEPLILPSTADIEDRTRRRETVEAHHHVAVVSDAVEVPHQGQKRRGNIFVGLACKRRIEGELTRFVCVVEKVQEPRIIVVCFDGFDVCEKAIKDCFARCALCEDRAKKIAARLGWIVAVQNGLEQHGMGLSCAAELLLEETDGAFVEVGLAELLEGESHDSGDLAPKVGFCAGADLLLAVDGVVSFGRTDIIVFVDRDVEIAACAKFGGTAAADDDVGFA